MGSKAAKIDANIFYNRTTRGAYIANAVNRSVGFCCIKNIEVVIVISRIDETAREDIRNKIVKGGASIQRPVVRVISIRTDLHHRVGLVNEAKGAIASGGLQCSVNAR